jgi:methylenetetrahydrofolate reductase (NADPH)
LSASSEPTQSRFARHLHEGQLALALEITPPKSLLPGVLVRRAALLGSAADAVNVIQRPGRLSSLDACIALLERGIDTVWHLVTRGRTREEIHVDLLKAQRAGLHQILCILGDHTVMERVESPTVREAVAMTREQLPSALIGATFNQYAPDRARALHNLLRKCDAGAAYVQTQPAFDPVGFSQVAREIRQHRPKVAVVPMVIPLVTIEAMDRIERRLGIQVPAGLRSRVLAGPESAWEAFSEIVAGLAATGDVQGLAVMTFETDPPPGTGERILGALRRVGIDG